MAGNDKRKWIKVQVSRALFDASESRCAMCGMSLLVEGGTHIAEKAHIAPVAPNGPRSGMLRPVDVDAIENLILLCPTHHRLIDKEPFGPRLWPAERVLALKAEHEGWIAIKRARPDPKDYGASDGPLPIRESIEIEGELYQCAGMSTMEWTDDRRAVRSAAIAVGPDGTHRWVRRVTAGLADTRGNSWRANLVNEAALLFGALPGLPEPVAFDVADRSVTLVTSLPSLTTMGAFYGNRARDPEGVVVFLGGLDHLRVGLRSLHTCGLSHGALGSETIMADRQGRLWLRDVGLAAVGADDPAEDVRRLAELVHLTVTGRLPVPFVLASVLNDAVPERAARGLARALASDPRERGDLDELIADLSH